MENENKGFSYTYSAKQQEEVKRIQQKYMPQEENKMEQLRRLDKSATKPGKIAAYIIGIISSLILGVGMCCTMVWPEYFVAGIIIGVVGMIGMSVTYPIYNKITKKQREKLAPQIIQLSKDLIQ